MENFKTVNKNRSVADNVNNSTLRSDLPTINLPYNQLSSLMIRSRSLSQSRSHPRDQRAKNAKRTSGGEKTLRQAYDESMRLNQKFIKANKSFIKYKKSTKLKEIERLKVMEALEEKLKNAEIEIASKNDTILRLKFGISVEQSKDQSDTSAMIITSQLKKDETFNELINDLVETVIDSEDTLHQSFARESAIQSKVLQRSSILMQAARDEYESQIENLSKALQSNQQKLDDRDMEWRQQQSELLAKNDGLKAKHHSLIKEITALEEMHKMNLEEVMASLRDMETERHEALRESQVAMAGNDQQFEKYQAKIKELTRENNDLMRLNQKFVKANNAFLKYKKSKKLQELDKKQEQASRIEELQHKLSEWHVKKEQELKAQQSGVSQNKNELMESMAERESIHMQAARDEYESRIVQLSYELKSKQEEIDDMQSQGQQSELLAENDGLRKQNNELKAKHHSLIDEITALEETHKMHMQEVMVSLNELEAERDEIMRESQEAMRLNQKFVKANAAFIKYKKSIKLKEMAQLIDDSNAKIEKYEKENDDLKEQVIKLQKWNENQSGKQKVNGSDIEELEKKLDKKDLEFENMKNENDKLCKMMGVESREKLCKAINAAVELRKNQHNKSIQKDEAAQKQAQIIGDLHKNMDKLNEVIKGKDEEIHGLTNDLMETMADKDGESKRSSIQMQAARDEYEHQIANLSKELQSKQEEIDDMQSQNGELKANHHALIDEITELEESHKMHMQEVMVSLGELEKEREEYKKEKNQLMETMIDSENRINGNKFKEIALLKASLQSMQIHMENDLKEEVEAKDQIIEELTSEKNNLMETMIDSENRMHLLFVAKIVSKNNEIEQLKGQIEKADGMQHELFDELTALRANKQIIGDLSVELSKLNEIIKAKDDLLKTSQDALVAKNGIFKKYEETIKDLTKQKNDLAREKNDLLQNWKKQNVEVIDGLNKKAKGYEEEMNKLKAELTGYELSMNENEQSKSMINELKKKMHEKDLENDKLMKQLGEQSKLHATIKKYEQEKGEMANKMNDIDAKNQELLNRIDGMENDLKRGTQAKDQIIEEKNNLMETMIDSENRMHETFVARISSKNNEIEQLKTALQSQTERHHDLEMVMSINKQELAKLQSKLEAITIENANHLQHGLSAELNALRAEKQHQVQIIGDLNDEMKKLNGVLESKDDLLRTSQEALVVNKEKFEKYEATIKGLTGEKNDLSKEVEELKLSLQKQQTEVTDLKESNKQQSKVIDDLNKKMKGSDKEMNKLKAELTGYELSMNENEQSESMIKELEIKMNEKDLEMQKIKLENDNLMKQMGECKEKLRETVIAVTELRKHAQSDSIRQQHYEDELAELHTVVQIYEQEKGEVKNKINELDIKNQESLKQINGMEKDLQDKKEKIIGLNHKYDYLYESKIKEMEDEQIQNKPQELLTTKVNETESKNEMHRDLDLNEKLQKFERTIRAKDEQLRVSRQSLFDNQQKYEREIANLLNSSGPAQHKKIKSIKAQNYYQQAWIRTDKECKALRRKSRGFIGEIEKLKRFMKSIRVNGGRFIMDDASMSKSSIPFSSGRKNTGEAGQLRLSLLESEEKRKDLEIKVLALLDYLQDKDLAHPHFDRLRPSKIDIFDKSHHYKEEIACRKKERKTLHSQAMKISMRHSQNASPKLTSHPTLFKKIQNALSS